MFAWTELEIKFFQCSTDHNQCLLGRILESICIYSLHWYCTSTYWILCWNELNRRIPNGWITHWADKSKQLKSHFSTIINLRVLNFIKSASIHHFIYIITHNSKTSLAIFKNPDRTRSFKICSKMLNAFILVKFSSFLKRSKL